MHKKTLLADDYELNQEMLKNILQNDELTGIYNRKTFFAKATDLLKNHEPGYYVLACFDINKFKVINDNYGTEHGDDALKFIAATIKSGMKEIEGICARFMADDFAVFYPRCYVDSEQIEEMHRKIKEYGKRYSSLSISIGRYIADDLTLPVSAMYDRALLALNSIKGDYEKKFAVYDESMRTQLLMEQQIISEMQDALSQGQFEPWFQPQYNHATGALTGAEALVRWRHPVKGLIAPAAFIPLFERNGFIYELDKYIWEKCCQLLKKWIEKGSNPVPISVNISRYDALRTDFFDTITGITEKYHISSSLFRLEITESAFSEASDHLVSVVKKLIHYGFVVEIDDFGSGYSSLNTLKDVPAQILKLDMRFFSKTDNENRSGNIIESIVRMAKWLGMAVIAEGVEEKVQADYLKTIGCYYIQGYYYAKPMPIAEYEELLHDNHTAKELQLSRLKTLDTLDNNEFWNPKSMETLIFNSYVGGACIFEYHDGVTELLRVNDRYAQEMGALLPQGDIIRDSEPIPYTGEENRQKLFQNIEKSIQSGKESTCEIMLSGVRDGKTQIEYIRSTVRVIARSGQHYLLYGVIVNTTAQHLAEQERIEAERKQMESAIRLEVIMKNINGGVSAIIINEDGTSRLIFTNDKYFELYGYTREQALEEHLDVMTTIHAEDFPSVMDKINRLKTDRMPAIIDYRITKPDGTQANLRANASLMYMEGYGDVVTSVVTDVTEIISLQDQLRVIVDNINGGVTATVIRDGKPEFIVVNDQFFRMLGYNTREEYDAELPDKYTGVHPEDRERIINQFETSDGGKKQYTMEYRVIRKDGEVRYIHNNVSRVTLFGIDEPVMLSVANDITESYLLQQKERKVTEQLQFLNKTAHDILAQSDSEQAIVDTLSGINDYFGADRGYVVELDYSNGVSNNTYEVCAEGVTSEKDNLQQLPFDHTDFWFETLTNNQYLIIEDVNELQEGEREFKHQLLTQNIVSMILVPLFRENKLIGFVGVDNPTLEARQIEQMTALADYISLLLVRRDMNRKIIQDHRTMELLLNDTPVGFAAFVYAEEKMKLRYCNERLYELMGYQKEKIKLTTDDLMKLVFDEDREIVENNLRNLVGAGTPINCVFRNRTQDGGYIWVDLKAAIADRVKEQLLINAVFMDVTELQKEKENIQKSEETARQNYDREMQLRTEVMKDSISYYQLNITQGMIEDYHSVHDNWLDIQDGEAVTENLRDKILRGIAREDHEKVRNTLFSKPLLEAYQKGKETVSLVFRSVLPSQELRWTLGTATIMERYYSGDLIALINNQDIDIRMKDQLAIGAIMNEEIESVAVVNLVSGIAHFAQLNENFTDLRVDEDFQYSERYDAMIQKVIVEADRKACELFFDLSYITRALEKEPVIKHLFRIKLENGEVRHKKTRAFYVDDTRQEIALINRDITDLYEEEKRQRHALQKAVDEAMRANHAKSKFLSRMSHDMRTPLNAILSFSAEEIIRNTTKDQYVDYMGKIHASGEYLLGIISDILDMARIEQNKIVLVSEAYSYNEFAGIIHDVIGEACKNKQILFTMDMRNMSQWIMTDRVRVNQVFINLLSNAVKFTKPGGRIEFTSYSEGVTDQKVDHRVFIIKDTGIGISEGFMPHVFENFTQENREQVAENYQGTGLGMPIAKMIIELMKGSITLSSEEGKGTEVTVRLPLSVIEPPVESTNQQSTNQQCTNQQCTEQEAAKSKIEKDKLNGTRILLCEDNDINAEIAMAFLEDRGCIVEWAENGLIGLNKFQDAAPGTYQAVLMDIRMPVMDGYTATKEIRKLKHPDAETIPIIALTADVFIEDAQKSEKNGLNAHLSKPIEPETLYQTLEKWIRQ